MNYERTATNKGSSGKIGGLEKLRKNDISQINLSYPYVVLMLSEKTA